MSRNLNPTNNRKPIIETRNNASRSSKPQLSEREEAARKAIMTRRDRFTRFVLPNFPSDMVPGYHLCWVSTSNSGDTPAHRFRYGYDFLTRDDVANYPDFLALIDDRKQSNGSQICVNEMVAMKIHEDLYAEMMTINHHLDPLAGERENVANVVEHADIKFDEEYIKRQRETQERLQRKPTFLI